MISRWVRVMIDGVYASTRYLIRDFYEIRHMQSLPEYKIKPFIDSACSNVQNSLQNTLQRYASVHNEQGEFSWLINPLDGQENFAHALPYFSLFVILQFNEKTVATVVYAPILKEMFWAEKNHGTYLQIEDKNIRLRTKNFHKRQSRLFDTNYDYQNTTFKTRAMGTMSLAIAYAAASRLDGVIYRNIAKQIRELTLLVTESNNYLYEYNDNLIACNHVIDDTLRAVIQ